MNKTKKVTQLNKAEFSERKDPKGTYIKLRNMRTALLVPEFFFSDRLKA